MADRSVKVRFDAVIDGYTSGVQKMQAETDAFATQSTQSATKSSQHWQAASTAMIGTGLAVAAGLGVAVSRFADFDQAMSAVQANTQSTGAELAGLRDLAIKMGADTMYSATEAAQAINEMAKAGVSTKDIMSGGLKGALDLAAAGQLDVARAAEIAATAVNQFGLEGKDVPHVADLMAAAANKAQGSVEDVAAAMKYVGPVAKSMGLSIEETTGVIAEFASKGIIGEQAGTSFRGMLLSLTAPSQAGAKALEQYGINVYDASGHLKSMAEVAGVLHDKLSPLDQATRNAALGQIFGNEQMTAAIALYEGGSGAVQDWTKQVNEQGFAAKQAATLTDNLKGDIERLGGSLDTVLIKTGSGANSTLRGLAQAAESAVNAFGDLPEGVQSSITGFAVLAAGSLLVGGGLIKVVTAARDAKIALAEMGITAETTSAKMAKGLGGVAAIAGLAEVKNAAAAWSATSKVATVDTDKLASSLTNVGKGSGDAQAFIDLFNTSGMFGKQFTSASDAVKDFGANAKAALSPEWYETATGTANQALAVYQKRVEQIDAALADMVKNGHADQAAKMVDQLSQSTVQFGGNADAVRKSFTQYNDALAGGQAGLDGTKTATDAASAAAGDYAGTLKQQKDAADAAAKAVDDATKALINYGDTVSGAINAESAWYASVDNATKALKDNGKTTADHGATLDLHTAKGRANQSALLDMADAAKKDAAAMLENGASTDQAAGSIERARGQFVDMAQKMGLSRDAANRLADQLGLTRGNVASLGGAIDNLHDKQVAVTVATYGAEKIASLQSAMAALHDKTVSITTVQTTQLKNEIAHGGIVNNAAGGYITGPGTGTSDSIPSYLSNGEYVVKAAAVSKYGVDFLHRINAMRFADGGYVSRSPATPAASPYMAASQSITVQTRTTSTAAEIADEVIYAARLIGRGGVYAGAAA